MEMATDQEVLAQAQARLLKKRQERETQGMGTENPTRLTLLHTTDFQPPKCSHGIPLGGGCEECSKAAASWERERKAEKEQEEQKRAEAKEKKRQERAENPEKWLTYYDVPRKFLGCSFDNYQGGLTIKAELRKFPDQSILLSGSTGCGKTHLAVATLRDMVQRDEIKTISNGNGWDKADTISDAVFTTVPDLLLAIRSSFSRNSDEKELVEQYTRPSVLILDDLGADKATEWAITTLYLIIDSRNKELMPTIVTTNLTMQEIEGQYGARIASRLSDMKIINIKMPDWRKRR